MVSPIDAERTQSLHTCPKPEVLRAYNAGIPENADLLNAQDIEEQEAAYAQAQAQQAEAKKSKESGYSYYY